MALSAKLMGVMEANENTMSNYHLFRNKLDSLTSTDKAYIENMIRVGMSREEAVTSMVRDIAVFAKEHDIFIEAIYDILSARMLQDSYQKATKAVKPDYVFGDRVSFDYYVQKVNTVFPGGAYTTYQMLKHRPSRGKKRDNRPKTGVFLGTRTAHCGFTKYISIGRSGDFEHETTLSVGLVCFNSKTDVCKVGLINVKKL